MDHESARAAFTEYHDGELAADDLRALEEHLAACPECAAEWAEYRRAIEEVSGLRVISPSEDFARQVSLAIELRRKRRGPGGLSITGFRVAVLTLILLMLFVMAYLTYLLLFAEPPKPAGDGPPATKHTQGDLEVIGPIRVSPPDSPDGERR